MGVGCGCSGGKVEVETTVAGSSEAGIGGASDVESCSYSCQSSFPSTPYVTVPASPREPGVSWGWEFGQGQGVFLVPTSTSLVP